MSEEFSSLLCDIIHWQEPLLCIFLRPKTRVVTTLCSPPLFSGKPLKQVIIVKEFIPMLHCILGQKCIPFFYLSTHDYMANIHFKEADSLPPAACRLLHSYI